LFNVVLPHFLALNSNQAKCYNTGMNKYELTLVLDGKAGAAKKKKVSETVEKVLALFKGAIKESKDWGVKELAYKIGKSETGLYLFFDLESDPKAMKVLNDKLRNDPDIIRFLVINKEK
jgi:small subunit ribosomal protein S6